ncbi:hypothetical protein [Pedobacter sp. ASV28]|uniref:hypothetical protein n=1 Tax=Pedobacter sp. ASV28 TaxID=2795123 RepID=UPI0018EDA6A9|nr:hypothetical protein [Pedobacter sp. ASV28]
MTKCLIEPIKQKYRCANDFNDLYELWTVLEETRYADGYRIYYDENTEMFGLAIQSNKDVLIDIGSYGTFLKALYSM